VNQFTISGSTSINVTATEKVQFDYPYTGESSTVTLRAGTYVFECWGAQGGTIIVNNAETAGGKGGYSYGLLTLSEAT